MIDATAKQTTPANSTPRDATLSSSGPPVEDRSVALPIIFTARVRVATIASFDSTSATPRWTILRADSRNSGSTDDANTSGAISATT